MIAKEPSRTRFLVVCEFFEIPLVRDMMSDHSNPWDINKYKFPACLLCYLPCNLWHKLIQTSQILYPHHRYHPKSSPRAAEALLPRPLRHHPRNLDPGSHSPNYVSFPFDFLDPRESLALRAHRPREIAFHGNFYPHSDYPGKNENMDSRSLAPCRIRIEIMRCTFHISNRTLSHRKHTSFYYIPQSFETQCHILGRASTELVMSLM